MRTIKALFIIAIAAIFVSCGKQDETPKVENQSSTQNVQPQNQTNPNATNNNIGKRWWLGQYMFEESSKNVTGGGAQTWNYNLEIKEIDQNTMRAIIMIDGFQTMTRLEAKVNATDMDIEFIFDKYSKDNMFEPYKPGDRLFSMMRNTQNVIMTNWGKLKANVVSNQESGKVMFKKIAS